MDLYEDSKLFSEGIKSMTQELDLVSVIDLIRKTHIMSRLIMNQHQRLLAEIQPINWLRAQNQNYREYPKSLEK